MSLIETAIAPLASMRLVTPDVRWQLETDAPALFEAVRARLPDVAALGRELCEQLPVQVDWHFGDDGPVSRPDRHVRAFYLDLPKLAPGLPGSIAIKGSEVWADNFETLVERLRLTWSIFTWSLGGPERHILEDVCMMDQLERFPVAEGKPPNVHPLSDALEEAEVSSAYQLAHLERYGEFAHVPLPLLACKWPDELRDRVYAQLAPWLSRKTKQIVENQLQGGMGTFVYWYPTIPIRVMHLQIPDASTAASGTSYVDRVRQLEQAVNGAEGLERAVSGWLRTATRMLALGWLPTDPASLGRGNCLMPQNLVLDGGIVDLDSLREIHTIATAGELQFAIQKSCRVLAQAIAWFFVGTSAGLARFEQMYADVYAFVWRAQRELLAREQLPPAVAEIVAAGDGLTDELHRYFDRSFGLGQFRPGDREDKRFSK
jgi:hypothetical protein